VRGLLLLPCRLGRRTLEQEARERSSRRRRRAFALATGCHSAAHARHHDCTDASSSSSASAGTSSGGGGCGCPAGRGATRCPAHIAHQVQWSIDESARRTRPRRVVRIVRRHHAARCLAQEFTAPKSSRMQTHYSSRVSRCQRVRAATATHKLPCTHNLLRLFASLRKKTCCRLNFERVACSRTLHTHHSPTHSSPLLWDREWVG
jgi:hypothetical protein